MSDTAARLATGLAERYQIEREIGQGGMATVYLAHDLKHRRRVAIKVLRPDLAASLGGERFLREIEIAAQLQHPSILPLYDSGEIDGVLYYVMPFVEGESLADRLARESPLPVDAALAIAIDVAGALAYAHERGVVHRDIKPDNIMLSGGRGVVADFGIARAVSAAGGDRLTDTGVAVGTPFYMSPEQATASGDLDARSDIYSLACVLYEMLAGQPPFTGPSARAVMARHAVDAPHSLAAVRSAVPQAVERAVLTAMHKVPADRFQTAGEFAEALSRPDEGVPSRVAPVRMRRALTVGVVAVAAAGAAVPLVVALRGGPGEAPAGPPKLAVLPFENLGTPDDEFFADGITEEITSRLAEISGLRVVSRTSAKLFQGSETPIPEIGRALQVDYVLTGSVRTDRGAVAGGQVRVTPQLIRASDDTYLWTRRYDAGLAPGEVFGVQADIAEQVAGALNVTLLEAERETVRGFLTEDPEAYRLYLLGRFQLESRNPDGLLQAQQLFRDAIGRDSGFAAAFAGLADAISLYNFHAAPEGGQAAWAPAEQAARRAIALDPELAEAHASLALTRMYLDWDWDGASRSFERALELEPDNPATWYWYAEVDWVHGRWDQAERKTRRALDLDPLSAVAQTLQSIALWFNGRRDEALNLHRRAVELQPSFLGALWFASWMHARMGRPDDARRFTRQLFERAEPGRPVSPALIDDVIRTVTGRSDLTTTVRVIRAWESYGLDNTAAGIGFAFAGLPDSAFARLDAAVARRNARLPLRLSLYQEFLGDDPRWPEILRRMDVRWK